MLRLRAELSHHYVVGRRQGRKSCMSGDAWRVHREEAKRRRSIDGVKLGDVRAQPPGAPSLLSEPLPHFSGRHTN